MKCSIRNAPIGTIPVSECNLRSRNELPCPARSAGTPLATSIVFLLIGLVDEATRLAPYTNNDSRDDEANPSLSISQTAQVKKRSRRRNSSVPVTLAEWYFRASCDFERHFRIAKRVGGDVVTNVTEDCEDAGRRGGRPIPETRGRPRRDGCTWPFLRRLTRQKSSRSGERKTADRNRNRSIRAPRAE